MNCRKSLGNVMPLNVLLRAAQEGVYAVGSFSPRCTPLIRPILRAAKKAGAPVVVQISQRGVRTLRCQPGRLCRKVLYIPC